MSDGYQVFVNNDGVQVVIDTKSDKYYTLGSEYQSSENGNHYYISSPGRKNDTKLMPPQRTEQKIVDRPQNRGSNSLVKLTPQQASKTTVKNKTSHQQNEQKQDITY